MTYESPARLRNALEKDRETKFFNKLKRIRAFNGLSEFKKSTHEFVYGYVAVRGDRHQEREPKLVTIGNPIRMTGGESIIRNINLRRKFMALKNVEGKHLWQWHLVKRDENLHSREPTRDPQK